MIEDLKGLHRLYNEVGKIQDRLPNKRGKKDYSDIEYEIIKKATELRNNCDSIILKLKQNNQLNLFSEVDNIKHGAQEIINNPYLKKGGQVDI
ncbi:hypothetical protein [Adhaeribacter aquaticus]|uniref:hypothetical protein n=1 Tax=Adhaeribacter aquaticus TaxID=299567 RepID=UPI000418A42A|nr:hypothetical protein [Adhaeribacter aquaticus]